MSTTAFVAAIVAIVVVIVLVLVSAKVAILVCVYRNRDQIIGRTINPDSQCTTLAIDKFLNDMEREKPIRFTGQQLRIATENYSNLLGSGGFGMVYKGIFNNGIIVAVKVLRGSSNKKIDEQFMAEVGTIGRIHHFNLVRLYGFCFERNLIALVYEYMDNGSLDRYLFDEKKTLEYEKLHEIAIGTARGIAYLHEECQQRIIHYDIKPGNILLDKNLYPKVADFGLAKLCNRENTHITMTGGRGTPGYAAPELWMPFPVTHKCDVYSCGKNVGRGCKWSIGTRENINIYGSKTGSRKVLSLPTPSNVQAFGSITKVKEACIQYRDGVAGKWQQIWQAKIPPKVKNLIWRIGRNVLQTRTRLNSRGVQFPTHCAVCTMETKTACTGYFYVQEVLNAGSEQISGNIYMQA
ncbi:G-type lectin S-receptor-like serine/threonine-kinase [Trifolium pratense]|uniref:G-type lectin S-receptor-like serine/threonine-kinase n=1 Tax=Trifolium pratense TaxID=57577 RepID=A0A2K3PP96_TRIPR|nr:G-type lectin S-receptor-like serine/threonine-kinase [Trifolium pratense]